jgi:hypothetical protein
MSGFDVKLHSSLHSTYRMLKCAYPAGVPEAEYHALILVLQEKVYEEEPVRDVLKEVTSRTAIQILDDMTDIESWSIADSVIEQVKVRLKPCGYKDWFEESINLDSFIPSYLLDTFTMLKCAFPNGIPEDDRRPLVSLLDRNMAMGYIPFLMYHLDPGYTLAEEHVYVYDPEQVPTETEIQRVQDKLSLCGFEDWLRASDV